VICEGRLRNTPGKLACVCDTCGLLRHEGNEGDRCGESLPRYRGEASVRAIWSSNEAHARGSVSGETYDPEKLLDVWNSGPDHLTAIAYYVRDEDGAKKIGERLTRSVSSVYRGDDGRIRMVRDGVEEWIVVPMSEHAEVHG